MGTRHRADINAVDDRDYGLFYPGEVSNEANGAPNWGRDNG